MQVVNAERFVRVILAVFYFDRLTETQTLQNKLAVVVKICDNVKAEMLAGFNVHIFEDAHAHWKLS